MAAATDREREIDMRMNDKLSIGTGRDREAAPDIRTEVRTDTIRAYLKKKLRSTSMKKLVRLMKSKQGIKQNQ